MRNYDMFVAKIYDYALIDSFWGFPGFIDSLTSYATLMPTLHHVMWCSNNIENKSGTNFQLTPNPLKFISAIISLNDLNRCKTVKSNTKYNLIASLEMGCTSSWPCPTWTSLRMPNSLSQPANQTTRWAQFCLFGQFGRLAQFAHLSLP